ncbi:MAG: phage portal protein [Phycisphaerales bacterium]|nr:phage portal protein [Phycisphaerales bacterium]
MAYELAPFASVSLDERLLRVLVSEHEARTLPRLRRLWNYYRNALAEPSSGGGSKGPPAQWVGLPSRLKSVGTTLDDDRQRREIVIENDIAWRVHTLVDFMFPAAPEIVSTAATAPRRERIESILRAVFEASGSANLWQDAALLGGVYGYVDVLVDPSGLEGVVRRRDRVDADLATRIGAAMRLEIVEPPRAIPLVSRDDYRRLDAYIIHYRRPDHQVTSAGSGVLARMARVLQSGAAGGPRRGTVLVTEIHSATHMQRYEDERLVLARPNRLGVLPIVHVQNLSQPLEYAGLSDVEPLIPLQDELNTRLSDRANRVTLQSFRMWLGKGIEQFDARPVGPGQMWVTDNLDASIEGFGGDADSPSERRHIEELREALDKASGVTPAAAGHIRARVGNLTSENALRISLMGTIAKIKRKRITYGGGIRRLCRAILEALDGYGVFTTASSEREVEIVWSDPLPVDESRRLADAVIKAQLGVPGAVLRSELGYGDAPGSSDMTGAAG